MPASTSPRCSARALRKEVDTSARTVNVAKKKMPDAIITSMKVKAPVEGRRASQRKNEKLRLVFIFFSHLVETRALLARPREGPKRRLKSRTAKDWQSLGEEVLWALRAAEADGPISMLNLSEPMAASNGFFAHKTSTIGGLDHFGTVDHFQLHLNSRRPCGCRGVSAPTQLRLLGKSL